MQRRPNQSVQTLLKVPVVAILLFWSISAAPQEDSTPDYQRLRLELAASKDYNPYTLQLLHEALLGEHYKLAEDPAQSVTDINKPLQQLADLYPLGVQVNFAVAGFLDYVASLEAEDGEAGSQLEGLSVIADQRRKKAQAILDSILASGDGKSPETAFVVINIIEEYAVMDHFSSSFSTQSVLEKSGKYYDLVVGTDADGTQRETYFDISAFYDASD